jgi:hypothetical protein
MLAPDKVLKAPFATRKTKFRTAHSERAAGQADLQLCLRTGGLVCLAC